MGRLPVSGGLVSVCPVQTAAELTAALAPGEQAEAVYKLEEAALTAPVSAGTRVGETVYYVNSKELARVPLVTAADIHRNLAEPSGWLGSIWERIAGL